jgi:hypothetical protein
VTAEILINEIKMFMAENKQFTKKTITLLNSKRMVQISELKMREDFIEKKCKI